MLREEGVRVLWTGAAPTIYRSMALNLGILLPYESIKELLAPILGDTRSNYCISSMLTGFAACLLLLPFDNARTKIMKM